MNLNLYKCYMHPNSFSEIYVIATNVLEAEQEAINEIILNGKGALTNLYCYRVDLLATSVKDSSLRKLVFASTRDVGDQLRIAQKRYNINEK